MDTTADIPEPSSPKPMGPWILQAASLSNCPLHRTGDRLLVRPPALHHAGSGCCLVPFLKLRTHLRDGKDGDIHCSWVDCAGTWSARREDSDEDPGWDPASLEIDLENRPFLLQLPQAVALALLNAGTRCDYPAGEVILDSGQVNNELYLVVLGALEVLEGDLRVATILRGECFGELSILTRQPTSNTVRTATPCTLVLRPPRPLPRAARAVRLPGHPAQPPAGAAASGLQPAVGEHPPPRNLGQPGGLPVPFGGAEHPGQRHDRTAHHHPIQGDGRCSDSTRAACATARRGEKSGEDALLDILRWTTGIFRFQDEPMLLEQNIFGETMAVLLDALRKFDEIQLQESTANVSTRLEIADASLTDTRWDPRRPNTTTPRKMTTEVDARTDVDADGTSEFDIGELGLDLPKG
jgi:hypothetical protein